MLGTIPIDWRAAKNEAGLALQIVPQIVPQIQGKEMKESRGKRGTRWVGFGRKKDPLYIADLAKN